MPFTPQDYTKHPLGVLIAYTDWKQHSFYEKTKASQNKFFVSKTISPQLKTGSIRYTTAHNRSRGDRDISRLVLPRNFYTCVENLRTKKWFLRVACYLCFQCRFVIDKFWHILTAARDPKGQHLNFHNFRVEFFCVSRLTSPTHPTPSISPSENRSFFFFKKLQIGFTKRDI